MPYLTKFIIYFLTTLFVSTAPISHAKIPQIIYTPKEIGHDANFNPISYYVNTAFDTIQNPFYFTQENFIKNHQIVYDRLRRPGQSLKDGGGFRTFLRNEVFGIRALPNYTLHLIGSGYDFRKISEWFSFNGYPKPYLIGFVLSYLGQLGNETIESTNTNDITGHDHLADIFIFDLLGKFLFMNDDITDYFTNKLNMLSWPYQPFFNPETNRIENAGANFILRPSVKNKLDASPFIHLGMQILFGLSLPYKGYQISAGTGPAFTDPLRNKSRLSTGFYLDQNNDLLASFIVNGTDDLKFRLNIYPGVIKWKKWTTGLSVAQLRSNEYWLAINFKLPLGIGSVF